MIITLIFASAFFINVVRHILYFIYDAKASKYGKMLVNNDYTNELREKYINKRNHYDHLLDKLDFAGDGLKTILCGVLGGVLSFVCLLVAVIVIIVNNSSLYKNQKITQLNMKRESLVYRLESGIPIGNEYLYNDIVEFNTEIYNKTYNHANPWISWFNAADYSEIEPIDYKEMENK